MELSSHGREARLELVGVVDVVGVEPLDSLRKVKSLDERSDSVDEDSS